MILLASLTTLIPFLPLQDANEEAREPELSIAGRAYECVERQANVFTASSQDRVALTEDGAGNWIVTWHSRRQEEGSYGIYARRFDAAGTPLGDELHINTTTRNMQMTPVVTVDDQGGVWFAWRSFGQDGDQGTIVARRFDPGFETATPEVVVNAVAAGEQTEPVLTPLEGGSVLCVWRSPGEDKDTTILRGRKLAADGSHGGEAFTISSAPASRDSLPTVETHPNGEVWVAFARAETSGVPVGVFLARFTEDEEADAGLSPRGEAVRVDQTSGIEPALSIGEDGTAVLGWFEAEEDGYAMRLRSLKATDDQVALGAVHPLTVEGSGYTSGMDVDVDEAGNVLVAWSRYADGPKREAGLFAQRFDRELEAQAKPFRATAVVEGKQRIEPLTGTDRIAHHVDGRMAFTWHGKTTDGDSSGANLTLLIPEGLELEPVELATTLSFEPIAQSASPHEPPSFDAKLKVQPAVDINLDRASADIDFLAVSSTGWTPPDPHMAVGANHIVVMTNGEIAFFDKDGTNTFRDEIENSFGFWGGQGATNFVFDPEVIWDPHSGRFMAMANERSSSGSQDGYYLLAISDDGDPNGSWHKYRINATPTAGGKDIDSPNIAVDATTIYLTADFFSPDRLHVMAVDKASVLNGGTPTTNGTVINGDQSMGIPVTYDAGAPAQYMIGFNFGTSSSVLMYAITDPLGAMNIQTQSVTVPSYSHPEDPPQMGTSSRPETFESRFWSAVYRNGSLWATHHVNGSRVRQRWYEFDMQGWPSSGMNPILVQAGEVIQEGNHRTYFGSIWVDADGVMALTYARSAPDEFISMERTWRSPTDALGTTRPPVSVITSTSPSSSGRWGDYSAIADDPSEPGRFWAHHEYYTSSWLTRVAGFNTTVAAAATFRNDAGNTNPTGYTANAPMIGTTWQASVDATGLSNTVAGVFGYLAPLEVLIPAWGEYLLIDVGHPAGEVLGVPVQAGTGVVNFSLAIPADPNLVGMTLSTQGASFGGAGGVNLHNAFDLTVGSF